jgi:hypothetical protein
MDIISEQKPKTETRIDVDIVFPNHVLSLTLTPRDTEHHDEAAGLYTITYEWGETCAVQIQKAYHVSRRTRIVQLPPDPADVPHKPVETTAT